MADVVVLQPELETSAQLAHSEAKIERATRGAFYEVGLELRHIRDHKLYRQQYGTFDEYVEQRWEMDKRRAYQLIDAASVTEEMCTIVHILPARESQVRPLLKLKGPEQRAEVWQRVIESGETITAKVVEAEVERKLAELDKDWLTLAEWRALSAAERTRILSQTYSSDKTFNETNDNIEWAAWSWNPITGCLHDCRYCYARDIANRFYPYKFEPAFLPSRLTAPNNTRVPQPRWSGDIGYKGVFVCSMADLFGAWVPQEWIDAVLATVRKAAQWNFIFLTKHPKRLAEIDWPANAWVGTTVDSQARVKAAEEAFANVNAPVRFLSCEPLSERLTFEHLERFNWLIIGGQSKSTAAPEKHPDFEWIAHLWRQWEAAGGSDRDMYWKTNLNARSKGYPIL